jgi:hypothetical protein
VQELKRISKCRHFRAHDGLRYWFSADLAVIEFSDTTRSRRLPSHRAIDGRDIPGDRPKRREFPSLPYWGGSDAGGSPPGVKVNLYALGVCSTAVSSVLLCLPLHFVAFRKILVAPVGQAQLLDPGRSYEFHAFGCIVEPRASCGFGMG